jgi:hypothetical protein
MARIRVKQIGTGKTGTIPEEQYDPQKYEMVGGTTMSNQMGGTNTDAIKQIIMMGALGNPKNASKYSSLLDIIEKVSPSATAAERENSKKNETAEKYITQLEDLYFKNKLYKGPIGGILSEAEAVARPGSVYGRYKKTLKSMRPTFAKIAGDVGNLAVQEQLAQEQLFPSARFTKEEAAQQFSQIRQKFGLQQKTYR